MAGGGAKIGCNRLPNNQIGRRPRPREAPITEETRWARCPGLGTGLPRAPGSRLRLGGLNALLGKELQELAGLSRRMGEIPLGSRPERGSRRASPRPPRPAKLLPRREEPKQPPGRRPHIPLRTSRVAAWAQPAPTAGPSPSAPTLDLLIPYMEQGLVPAADLPWLLDASRADVLEALDRYETARTDCARLLSMDPPSQPDSIDVLRYDIHIEELNESAKSFRASTILTIRALKPLNAVDLDLVDCSAERALVSLGASEAADPAPLTQSGGVGSAGTLFATVPREGRLDIRRHLRFGELGLHRRVGHPRRDPLHVARCLHVCGAGLRAPLVSFARRSVGQGDGVDHGERAGGSRGCGDRHAGGRPPSGRSPSHAVGHGQAGRDLPRGVLRGELRPPGRHGAERHSSRGLHVRRPDR